MKQLKNILILAVLTMSLAAASGCRQTAHGAGEDMENAGRSIQRSTN